MEINFALFVFGALGDLALRKLYTSLYYLADYLEDKTRILCIARQEINLKEFRELIKISIKTNSTNVNSLEKFLSRLDYSTVYFDDFSSYKQIAAWLNRVQLVPLTVYLSVPSSLYGVICSKLKYAGCLNDESRVVVEKPIGYNLASSIEINNAIGKIFEEKCIYRIDHYLGKETVQNLLALRFANPLFCNQWNHYYTSHVEITVAETVGIEGRWGYFDLFGQMRDMMQNHLMQLLCMIAMEPPRSLYYENIRDEKVKVLQALRPIDAEDVVRGQYSSGYTRGMLVSGYLEEDGDGANVYSHTETYVALKTEVSNLRWAGVQFYLCTGKRMPDKNSQIIIHFRKQQHDIFENIDNDTNNKLILRIQPNEGIALKILTKEEGMCLRPGLLKLNFTKCRDAYERLLIEVINGRQDLFVRLDEVEYSWRWIDKLIASWEQPYPAGSCGPVSAVALITRDERLWHDSSIIQLNEQKKLINKPLRCAMLKQRNLKRKK